MTSQSPHGQYLTRDRQRLDRLGLFSEIAILRYEEQDGVRLQVKVRETFPLLPLVSVGVSDENGVSAGFGIKAINVSGRDISWSSALEPARQCR